MAETPQSPVPPTEFLRILARSGVLPADTIQSVGRQIPREDRTSTIAVARWFVQHDLITVYQARKLVFGIWQGMVMGPYCVLSPIGRGGMGAVYLARDTRLTDGEARSRVALKVLPPKKYQEEYQVLARFLREMRLGQSIQHPHITEVYETGDHQGIHYIAMEYVPGINLQKFVRRHGRLSPGIAARLFMDVGEGLAFAHRQGLVHRDLKLSNMMVTPTGIAKLLDLGLAISQREKQPVDKTIIGGRGYVVGSMDYIAPEQIADAAGVDGRADLYSLGCSLYYATTGTLPYAGGTNAEKLQRHKNELARSIVELVPTIPQEFASIVERLMRKTADLRFQTAEEVMAALAPWQVSREEVAVLFARGRTVDAAEPGSVPVVGPESGEMPAGEMLEFSTIDRIETEPQPIDADNEMLSFDDPIAEAIDGWPEDPDEPAISGPIQGRGASSRSLVLVFLGVFVAMAIVLSAVVFRLTRKG